MEKKPANLTYGVNESPGLPALLILGVQHIFLLSVAFIVPVIIVDAIGGTPEQAQNLITMAMIATGLATILQGLNSGPVGSGYLCPLLNGPAFLSASLLAGHAGGLPLIFGMTAVGGIFEGFLSRVIPKMRAIFPSEVTGTIVMMVGIEVIPLGVTKFLGVDKFHHSPYSSAAIVGMITLCAMTGFNVWGKGELRLYSVLIGLLCGYCVAFFAGVLTSEHLGQFINAPFFKLPPFGQSGISFNIELLIPFIIAALSSTLKTMGDLTTCQKINNTEWKRPDMQSISRGVLACSLGNLISGLCGALGQSVSSSNIGLSIATGATSRKIAYSIGGILIFAAFFPKLTAIFVVMPTPLMGATLIFTASFMIISGIQIITSRLIDSRKTFLIGISVIFGLSVDLIPGLYKEVHPWFHPIFSSSLSLATVCALILNLFFRIGISKSLHLELTPGVDSADMIFTALEKQGALWGAMKDVMDHAGAVINEFLESATRLEVTKENVNVKVSFDEFNLDVDISYHGVPLSFPEKPPTEDELLAGESGILKLSGFLMKQHADSMKSYVKEGQCFVHFHFEH